MSVASRIKEMREQRGMSRSELAEKLGVTVGAISNYENGVSSPKEPILFGIIEALACDANYLFQDVVNIPKKLNDVTMAEFEKIKMYRKLDSHGKELVDFILNKETERITAAEQEHQKATSPKTVHLTTYYQRMASAGNGEYLFDDMLETQIPILDTEEARQANFAVGVNGDSMEPDYKDGDIVLVKAQEVVNVGEIGIFVLNNDSLIKKAGENCLISLNPKYKNILISDSDNLQCVGKVLGKARLA